MAKVVVGLGLLAWLLSSVELEPLLALAATAEPRSLTLGLGCLLAAFPVLQTMRLHALLRAYTGGLGASFRLFFVGALFNNVLPSNVGGDAARLYYLRARADELTTPLLLLLVHRATQLGLLLLVACVCALAAPGRLALAVERVSIAMPPSGLVGGVSIAVALLVVALLATPPGRRVAARLGNVLSRLADGLRGLRGAMLAELTLWTLLFHLARLSGFSLLASGLGQSPALVDLVFVLALTAVAGLLPISVGGLGVMEGAIVAALVVFGVAAPVALSVALLNRTVLLLNACVGGLMYLIDRDRILPTPAAVGPEGSS